MKERVSTALVAVNFSIEKIYAMSKCEQTDKYPHPYFNVGDVELTFR